MSDDLSPRDRRRQQAKANKSVDVKGAAGTALKKATPLIIILALAGFVAGGFWLQQNQAENAECPGHWHSTFQVWVDDQMVTTYQGYTLESGRLSTAMHMHQGQQQSSPYEIHWEPGVPRCEEFGNFLQRVDTHVSKDSLTLEGLHEDSPWGGSHEADGNKTVQAFIKPEGGAWRDISVSSLKDRQPKDGEKALILYGSYTEERVAQIQAGVPFPPSSGTDPDHGSA